MAESIQCYQCGTRMALAELVKNQDDCPECGAQHSINDVVKALELNTRAQLPSQGGEAVAVVEASSISEHSAFRSACVDPGLHNAFESHVMSMSESRRPSDFRICIDGEYVNSWMRANFAMFCAGRDATTKDSLAVAQADDCADMVLLLRESLPAVRYEAQRDDLAGAGYRQLVKRIEDKLATMIAESEGAKP